ncbi:MAG TPA: tRNA pseudouridine(13) synthase TruD [Candidatus Nanoarchaeia archaeon]|nr:tRNA pseudouridine(13) synthase TruD [Candidatus Nanoarchaeia archaeon]
MYKLKQTTEDFQVTEITSLKIDKTNHRESYTYLLLKKKSRNTLDVIKQLAKKLNLKEKEIGFAGSKDKQAVTEQFISVPGTISKEKLDQVKIDNCHLTIIGCGGQKISLGDLKGNEFVIVARNLPDKLKISPVEFIPNYFDEQRFSKNNTQIGRLILKRKFKEAAELTGYKDSSAHLLSYPNDGIGALKKLPPRLLRMYINAFQSYVWNETLSRYLELKAGELVKTKTSPLKRIKYSLGEFIFINLNAIKDRDTEFRIPLVGFSTEFKDLILKETITNILAEEEITIKEFIIKQLPQLTLEGEERRAWVKVEKLSIGKLMKDELNSGRKKVKIIFFLGKGSYATIAVRALIS